MEATKLLDYRARCQFEINMKREEYSRHAGGLRIFSIWNILISQKESIGIHNTFRRLSQAELFDETIE